MDVVKNLIETMNFARQEKGVKLRWPVRDLLIKPARGKGHEMEKIIKNFGDVIKSMGNVKEIKVLLKNLPLGKDFSLGKLAFGDVLLDEALVRELTRKVQMARKQKKLCVKDRINIRFDSDRRTTETLKKHEPELLSGVGAAKATFDKIEGAGLGRLDFKKIKIKFEFEMVR